jgi:hypothetical protein
MRHTLVQFIFGHIIPLLLGAGIYLVFRTDSLKVFEWMEALQVSSSIDVMRTELHFLRDYLPQWVLFSLPDGLWLFSGINLILCIWRNEISPANIGWLATLCLIAIGSELLQFAALLSGTFDFRDLSAYSLAIILSFIIFRPRRGFSYE